tara:strand:+ start:97522 stop:98823 length:1302 start_codon:yes stop_codon:yes gene_type:complete
MTNINKIKKNILNREIRIGVIGLGYVGLPIIVQLINRGYKVVGFDIDKEKNKKLNKGESYIKHISKEKILSLLENDFLATSDWSKINSLDIIIICVPTPLSNNNEPDLSFLENTLNCISDYFNYNQLLILESTSFPGTTREIVLPFIEKKGFKIGNNFFLSYSPEREDPGNKEFPAEIIPKIISGITDECLGIVKTFYDEVFKSTVSVSSTDTAEMTKLLENIYRAVNIGLVNEMKIISKKMGINIHEVIGAASTKPFGYNPFQPGPGIGGHCIPVDPFYLTWKAKKIGIETHFIEAAGLINAKMPVWVVNQLKSNLFLKDIGINNSSILVIGIAYKKNLDDIRESPALKIIELLLDQGAKVSYHDPFIKKLVKTRKYNFNLESVDLKKLNNFDCVIIITDHDSIDYSIIENESKLIFDTRGRLKNNSNVIQI